MPASRLNRSAGGSIDAPLRPWASEKRLSFSIAIAVFAAALVLLGLGGEGAGSADRLSAAAAERGVLAEPTIHRYLERSGYTRARTIPLDDRSMRVSFFNGSKIVLDAAVAPDRHVSHTIEYRAGDVRAGSEAIQTPLALALLGLIFALVGACVPLRRVRNLDVLALISFSVPIVLLNERLLELSVYASYPPLAYLGARCLQVAFAREGAGASRKATPLYEAITATWSGVQRVRMLGILAVAAAVALVTCSVAGGSVGDVGFASMAGATQLLDGRLPYGHLPSELVHGDTYPLLAYALYMPAALFMPVNDAFDNLDGALIVAAAAALVTALGIYVASIRMTDGEGRGEGLRNVIAWLVFPPVLITASTGSNDLVAAACVAGALALALHASRSTMLVTTAGWVKLVPFFLLPLLVARFRSGRLVAVITAAAATLAVAICILLLGGSEGAQRMLDAMSFQTERGSFRSLWALLGIGPLQLAFQATVLALVALSAVLVSRDRALAGDPRRVAALAGAIMIGFQLGANNWSYAYLPWVLPCVMIALLAGTREAETPRTSVISG